MILYMENFSNILPGHLKFHWLQYEKSSFALICWHLLRDTLGAVIAIDCIFIREVSSVLPSNVLGLTDSDWLEFNIH